MDLRVLDWAVAFWLGGGLLAFSAWAIWAWATRVPEAGADLTTRLVGWIGRGLVWGGALLLAGAVFGLAARAAWTLVR